MPLDGGWVETHRRDAFRPRRQGLPEGWDQLMWIPEIARAITNRCTSEVPSKMV